MVRYTIATRLRLIERVLVGGRFWKCVSYFNHSTPLCTGQIGRHAFTPTSHNPPVMAHSYLQAVICKAQDVHGSDHCQLSAFLRPCHNVYHQALPSYTSTPWQRLSPSTPWTNRSLQKRGRQTEAGRAFSSSRAASVSGHEIGSISPLLPALPPSRCRISTVCDRELALRPFM